MTIQDLTTAPAVLIGIAMMDADEARQIVSNINRRTDQSRRELLELHDREGWRALGYRSWGACVRAEFGGSAATLYRQLDAAMIERDVLADSQIENPAPIPTTHLQEVKQLPPAQRAEAFKRADVLAGAGPRTAKHIEQAAAELALPDLPADYAVIKRRLSLHGITLSTESNIVFVLTDRAGAVSRTAVWEQVQDRLSLLEDGMEDAPSDSAAHKAKEARDAGRLERARSLIASGEHDAARTVLDRIEVATYTRDQVLRTIPALRQITIGFTPDECAALRKEAKSFEHSGLIARLPTIGHAVLLLVQGMRGGT
jgi:hypothetical protein